MASEKLFVVQFRPLCCVAVKPDPGSVRRQGKAGVRDSSELRVVMGRGLEKKVLRVRGRKGKRGGQAHRRIFHA